MNWVSIVVFVVCVYYIDITAHAKSYLSWQLYLKKRLSQKMRLLDPFTGNLWLSYLLFKYSPGEFSGVSQLRL